MLVNLLVRDLANRSEALKFFRFIIFEFRGIENHPILHAHALQRRGFAMIGLDKPARQPTLKMVFRRDNNPIMSRYFCSYAGNYI
jgi:hypothetical protein